MKNILDKINTPLDLKKITKEELQKLAFEIRDLIVNTISKTGGHLASSLGVVEITLALHYIFNAPNDKIIWDVGHQTYAHKIVTGRKEEFKNIRQFGGLSGFPKRKESVYDIFGTGHSSTSISAALGFVKSRDLNKLTHNVVAIIGDGALTGGMAFEALNNAGHSEADLIVILNDNEMSISKNVGALAAYLSKLRIEPHFIKARKELQNLLKNIPAIGKKVFQTARTIESHLTFLLVPGVLFEALGFTYLGPFDGHNLNLMCEVFEKVKLIKGPRLIHLLTKKGKGYLPAEENSTKFHGSMPFDIETGETEKSSIPTYTKIFGDTLIELAKEDQKIVAITAAMPDGTGLVEFSKLFPSRFFDVGIAEQHAVTFASALSAEGFKPIVAIYSTFLQRAYDQIIHDVALQNLSVIFILDRAGIVGEDGPTHHGNFDISYLRIIPNLILMAPKDENELRHMLKSALSYNQPVVIRYPRSKGVGVKLDKELKIIPLGEAELFREGKDLLFLSIGNMVYPSFLAAEKLASLGIEAAVLNSRFIKPLDEKLIFKLASKIKKVITIEENVRQGGFGSAVLEFFQETNLILEIRNLALPDQFIEHGHPSVLREKYNLTADGIFKFAKNFLQIE